MGGGGWGQLTTVGFCSSKQQVTTCIRSSQVSEWDVMPVHLSSSLCSATALQLLMSLLFEYVSSCFIPLISRLLNSHVMLSQNWVPDGARITHAFNSGRGIFNRFTCEHVLMDVVDDKAQSYFP